METAQVNRLMVEITRLSSTAGEVHNLLAAQQKVLKMRGDFQLDEELLTQIESTHREIDRVREILAIQQPELAQLRALVRTMSMINSTLDLNKILNDVMDTFVDLTDAERGLIVLLDPITHEMEFRVVSGMDEDTINKANFMVSRTVVESVASSGEPVITTNALEDKAYEASQSIISYAVRSIICVPLKVKQQVIGVVYLDHRYRQAAFGENELQFLAAFANQAAIAIENARLFDDVQQRLAEISEIRNFLDNIFSSIISGVITMDTDGIILTTNRAAETMLGIKWEDSLGKPYTEVFPALYEGFVDLLALVMKERRQHVIEINPVVPERGPVNLNLKLSPLVDANSDRTQGVAIVIDDLTEIKKHDETIRVVNTYLSQEMVANIQSIDNIGLSGEDRIISALFADVRGFTTFSEQLDPEELMTVINQYLSLSSDALQVNQGVIDKFMGDAVLGLYNTQLNPQEDHALRAVASAIIMMNDVAELHKSLPDNQKLLYGIGIHTGPATLGNIGSPSRKEFTAIGEAVVDAKKLQECALGGEIIISEETCAMVKNRYECEQVERQLRGEKEYRRMYKVLSIR